MPRYHMLHPIYSLAATLPADAQVSCSGKTAAAQDEGGGGAKLNGSFIIPVVFIFFCIRVSR